MRPAELNPSRLPFLFKQEFELCAAKSGETIVLVSDLKVRPEYVAAAFAAAQELGVSIYEMKLNAPYSTTHIGGEHVFSVKGGIEAIEAADLCICFHIPLGSEWMERGRAAGTRFLMIYDHPDDLERLLSPPGLKEATEYAVALVEGASELRVVSEWGTDFTAKLSPKMVTTCQYGYAELPGRVDHWGAGHFSTWPLPNQSWGAIVLKPGDAWILPYVRYVEDETRLTIENGIITNIEGKTDAKLIRDFFEGHKQHPTDDEPYHVSHLGWGLHPNAILDQIAVHGNDIERVGGTGRGWTGSFLFSTGPNAQGGGTNNTRAHLDLPMFDCTVLVDDRVVIDKGRIIDPQMIVPPVYPNRVAY